MSAEGGPGSARLWVLTLASAVVAAVFGYVGLGAYLQEQAHASGFWERLYYTAQMFVLGPVPVDKPNYNVPLGIGLFLAPLTTVLAVLQAVSTVFRTQYVAWRLRHARGHAVVVGSGPAAFVLAQRLARGARHSRRPQRLWRRLSRAPESWRTRTLTATVLVGSDVTAAVARRHDLHVVPGDPMDAATLQAAGVAGAAEVFALAESGSANAAVALLTRKLHQEHRDAERRARRWLLWRLARGLPERLSGRGDPPLPRVDVYARADDPRLVAAMRIRQLGAWGAETDGYGLDFFSIEQRAAVALLDRHDDPSRTAAVVGCDPFAQALEAELALRRRRAGSGAAVTVVPTARWHTVPHDVDRVYVSAENSDEVLSTGLQLFLYGCRVVLCVGRRSLLGDALEKRLFDDVTGHLTVFGVLDAACDPDRLRHRALVEQLARALHAHYLRHYPAPAGSTAAAHSHVPWDDLAEPFRADNRAQASHISTKLARIGAVVVPAVPGLGTFAYRAAPDGIGDDEIEQLAKLEHDRWMQVKTDAGVRWGPERTPGTHPDYLPWERGPDDPPPVPGEPRDLSEEAREKDRIFVRELPALLAGEGLAIVRLAEQGSDQNAK